MYFLMEIKNKRLKTSRLIESEEELKEKWKASVDTSVCMPFKWKYRRFRIIQRKTDETASIQKTWMKHLLTLSEVYKLTR